MSVVDKSPKSPEPAAIDGWISLRPTHLHPSAIPAGRSATASATVFSSTLLPRQGHATSHPKADGKLYIFGGRVHLSGLLNDLWLYSLRDNTATLIQTYGDLPSPRAWCSISVVGNILVVWGGRCEKVTGGSYDNSLYLLDLDTHEWTKIKVHGPAPVGRENHAVATVGSTFYIFGGCTNPGSDYLNDLWSIDLKTLRSQAAWRSIEPLSHILPPSRQGHSWVYYQDQLISFGGNTNLQQYNDVWSFDLKTLRWTELPYTGRTPTARNYHRATIVDDVIYAFGGFDGTNAVGDLAAFKIPMRRWFTFETTGPTARCSHTVVSVGSLVYVLGGWTKVPKSDADVAYILDTETIEELTPGSLEALTEKETEEKKKWEKMWEKQSEKMKAQLRKSSMDDNKKKITDLILPVFIKAQDSNGQTGLHSKFMLEGLQDDPETEIEETWTFSINTDIAIPSFYSLGANDDPPQRKLQGTYQKIEQLSGFDRFSGRIGKGRFYLRTDRGVVVKGEIVGGPQNGQSFTGAGTWLRS